MRAVLHPPVSLRPPIPAGRGASFEDKSKRWVCAICNGKGRVKNDHYLRLEAQSNDSERQCFACGGTGKPKNIPAPRSPFCPHPEVKSA